MTALFGDAGPGPLIVPILGGLGIAGVFLAAGVVAGGYWLVHGSAAPRARKFFLWVTGVFGLGASIVLGLMAETQPEYGIAGAVFAPLGLVAFVALFRSGPATPTLPDDPVA